MRDEIGSVVARTPALRRRRFNKSMVFALALLLATALAPLPVRAGDGPRIDPPAPPDRLPPGTGVPDHVIDDLHARPRIEEFRATTPDCPRDGARLGSFLRYRVSNGVKGIVIHALDVDGNRRVAHTRNFRPPTASFSGAASDPGLQNGQVAYVLEATGAGGRGLSRRIRFRTSDRPDLTFEGPWREVLVPPHPRNGRRSRYEADVDVTNLASISKFTLVLEDETRSRVGPTPRIGVEFRNGRLVSGNLVWDHIDEHPPSRVKTGLLAVEHRDQCRGAGVFEVRNPVRTVP